MKFKKVLCVLILSIIFIVYSLIAFMISPNLTSTFWWAYIFTIVAFTLFTISMIITFGSLTARKAMFCDLTTRIISIAYLIIQMILGSIFMAFSNAPTKFVFIVEVIFVAIYIITYILVLIGKNIVQDIESDTYDKVLFIRLLSDDVMAMIDKTTDNEIKVELEEIKSTIDASDPVSNNALININKKISMRVSTLSSLIDTNNKEEIKFLIVDIKQMLLERNRKCKTLK